MQDYYNEPADSSFLSKHTKCAQVDFAEVMTAPDICKAGKKLEKWVCFCLSVVDKYVLRI